MKDLTNLNCGKGVFICQYSTKKSVCLLVFIEPRHIQTFDEEGEQTTLLYPLGIKDFSQWYKAITFIAGSLPHTDVQQNLVLWDKAR